jgi:hypothetical protein
MDIAVGHILSSKRFHTFLTEPAYKCRAQKQREKSDSREKISSCPESGDIFSLA